MTDTLNPALAGPDDPPEEPRPSGGRGRRKSRGDERVVIKKYANRRLYNTGSSSYVTLDDLSKLVRDGSDFIVFDAKTNEDITRQILTQIIFEEENASGAQNLLPTQFLRQLIRMYGDQMQSFVPAYLEMSLEAFARQQGRLREQLTGPFKPVAGFGLFDEQVRQNLALFDRAMKMFTPMAGLHAAPAAPAAEPSGPRAAGTADPHAEDPQLKGMREQIEAMQRQIAELAATRR